MNSFFLGIDVSKGYADFVILDDRKKTVLKNFQLDDTDKGHQQLFKIIDRFLKQHPQSELFAAVESTGGYENNWYNSLKRLQQTLAIYVARLNPLGVMHNSKADLKRNNTDKISASNVAEYLIAHSEKVNYQQHDQWASLRKQWGFIKMLNKQATELRNQLESLLYAANPDVLRFCKNGVSAWVLKLLLKYPTAAKLARARMSAVAKIPYISKERARELIDTAKQSVASATDSVTGQLIQATVSQILGLRETIATQEKLMIKHCSNPDVELLTTFKGIADSSAIGLMLQIQKVERFSSAKKLASFFGLHPVFKISGDGSSATRMSKQGRKEARRILYTVALTAIRWNPLIRDVYAHHLSKGKCRMDAVGICMHKIARIIYGMLKKRTPFDPEIDMKNRQRVVAKAVKGSEDKNRRFQQFDPQAPVSRRQNIKRLERKAPQCVDNTECGVIAPVPEPVT